MGQKIEDFQINIVNIRKLYWSGGVSSNIRILLHFAWKHLKTFQPKGKVKIEDGHLLFSFLWLSLV